MKKKPFSKKPPAPAPSFPKRVKKAAPPAKAPPHKPKKAAPAQPPKKAPAPKVRGQLIMGKNCVKEVLKHSPKRLHSVFTSKEGQDDLVKALTDARIPVQRLSKDELSLMVESDSHQSFIAHVEPRNGMDAGEYLVKEKSADFVIALDSVSDPQNLGAILRAAECFGVGAVMWSKNRGVEVTPVVSKVSVGASEIVPLIKVSNLAEALKKFKDNGYWVVATEISEHAESLFNFTFPEKTVLVLGSEGEGIRKLLSSLADFRIYIPMSGNIDSLNVSQATAVVLSHWKK